MPYSVPSAGHADFSIKKPRCNLLLQRGLQSRGERIRTSDLLNPIQAVHVEKIAKIAAETTYRFHTSHILRFGTHNFHRSRPVS